MMQIMQDNEGFQCGHGKSIIEVPDQLKLPTTT